MTCASKQRRRRGAPCRNQSKTGRSSGVDTELGHVRPLGVAAARPGVLGGRVEGGAGEVEADADQGAGRAVDESFGLQPGQQPQRLRVALEAAAGRGDLVEHLLAVVPERRVAQVVGEAGRLDEVGVAAQGRAQLPADLGALQGVGEPGAGAGVPGLRAGAGRDDLCLAGEPPQRGGVQDARAVPLERGAAGALVRLGRPALGVVRSLHAPTVSPQTAGRGAPSARSQGLQP